MELEIIVVIVIAVIVMAIFGAFRRKRSEGTTRVIIVDNDKDVRLDGDGGAPRRGGSAFKSILLTLVSLGAGFALSGFLIVEFVEPEIGPVDPWSPLAIGMYLVAALVIYGILRLFVRN